MGVVTAFIYWFVVGFLYFLVGVPYVVFKLSTYCLQRGFTEECSVGCRLLTFVLMEVAINMAVFCIKTGVKASDKKTPIKSVTPTEDETNRLMENSKLSQTASAWKLNYDVEERDYEFSKEQLKLALKRQRKKRQDIVIKFKKTKKVLEKEYESKTKLLANMQSKTMSVALDTESLITQIRNSKATLERLRELNRASVEQYVAVLEQFKLDYNHFVSEVDTEQLYMTNGIAYE